MMPWNDINNSQILDSNENEKFWPAFQNHDDIYLRSHGELAYQYWEHILATEAH
jgi:hypothetical protein